MLLRENARGKRVCIVVVEHRNRSLKNDRAVVQLVVDKVHGAARHLHAVVEGLLLRVEAGEGRQQRGMDVENAMRKRGHELRRQQPHVAGKTYQIHAARIECCRDIGVVLRALAAF